MVAGKTVLLGQFLDENADEILDRLESAGIATWEKRSGGLTRTLFAGEWGVRIFVDADRHEEAARIARSVTGS